MNCDRVVLDANYEVLVLLPSIRCSAKAPALVQKMLTNKNHVILSSIGRELRQGKKIRLESNTGIPAWSTERQFLQFSSVEQAGMPILLAAAAL